MTRFMDKANPAVVGEIGRIHTLFLVGDGALRRPRRDAAQAEASKEEKSAGLRRFPSPDAALGDGLARNASQPTI
ncbi:MAG TPA: hypothetical protein VFF11_13525 [Candidatus Binatia bacterium]|nr:hypothetical protein [Candidatus Binatia bacterium]